MSRIWVGFMKRWLGDSSWVRGMWVVKLGNTISVCDVWLSLPVYLLLCHTVQLFFLHNHCTPCVPLPLMPPSQLPGECGFRQSWDMLSRESSSCIYHIFYHIFSYGCQCSPIPLPFSFVLSLLLSLSPFPSRVQLPVSRPLCLNSINSQRNLFASEYQSACLCVPYLCMQALSTLCKCVMYCIVCICQCSVCVFVQASFVLSFSLSLPL